MGEHMARTPRDRADEEIRTLNQNLTILGVAVRPSGQTRAMIRRWHATRVGFFRALLDLFLFFFIPTLVLRIYLEWVKIILAKIENLP
jgi:hypothetical protein